MKSISKFHKKLFTRQFISKLLPYLICFIFVLIYSILGIVKHNQFLSGYDLAIADQAVWKYSHFQNAITTVNNYYTIPLLFDHVEIIYILISPLYWIASDARTLIFLQALIISLSGIPVFLISKQKKLNSFLSIVILISYLSFYGIQNALWSDVHSLVFAAGLIPWFVYFLEHKKLKLTFIFLILSIICKEDIALITLFISLIYLVKQKSKISFYSFIISIFYLIVIFLIYFPHFTNGYLYANPHGIFSEFNILNFANTKDKQLVILYSLSWFGFIPLLNLLFLLPAIVDLSHYFILGNTSVTAASTLFLHYRVTLSFLLILPLIYVLSKHKKLNSRYTAFYLLFCCLFFQYYLHLPISYLTKKWFWQNPPEVNNINKIIASLPSDASVVAQSNISPHITHRDKIYTLFPETKTFTKNSSCSKEACNWFHWGGNPNYLIADLGNSWDIRHFLTNRDNFIDGIRNLEKAGIITLLTKHDTAILYKINRKP